MSTAILIGNAVDEVPSTEAMALAIGENGLRPPINERGGGVLADPELRKE